MGKAFLSRIIIIKTIRGEQSIENVVEKYITENKEILHHNLIDTLKLYKYEKEYCPYDCTESQARGYGYIYTEQRRGNPYYYKEKKVYPELTDDEYAALLEIARTIEQLEIMQKQNNKVEAKKQRLELSIAAKNNSGSNFAVTFMKVLTWILWIGGIIVSILSARVEVTTVRYYTETIFQWPIFLSNFILYFVAGAICMCMSVLFANIQTIANAINSFNVTGETK